jgi:hypothetical protein
MRTHRRQFSSEVGSQKMVMKEATLSAVSAMVQMFQAYRLQDPDGMDTEPEKSPLIAPRSLLYNNKSGGHDYYASAFTAIRLLPLAEVQPDLG